MGNPVGNNRCHLSSNSSLFDLQRCAEKVFPPKPKGKKSGGTKTVPIRKDSPAVDRSGATPVKWLDTPLPRDATATVGSCAAEICRQFKSLCPIDCYVVARIFHDNMDNKRFDRVCHKLPDTIPGLTVVEEKQSKCEDASGIVVPVVKYEK